MSVMDGSGTPAGWVCTVPASVPCPAASISPTVADSAVLMSQLVRL